MPRVKKNRPYDARGRVERARRSRETILETARAAFLAHGYEATTIAAVAESAGVSVETIYKAFGGKAGLVRAIFQRGLEGVGETPAEERSDAMSARENDPRDIVRKWGALAAEVAPLVSPILLLVRSAAATDRELADLLRESDEQRLARMQQNARVLAKRGFLRADVSVAAAAELMWAYTSPELYDLYVVRRGYSPKRFGELTANVFARGLLSP